MCGLMKLLLLVVAVVLWSGDACAYLGPGIGAGTIGLILGFLASVGLAIVAIVWYPVKRLIRKFKKAKDKEEAS